MIRTLENMYSFPCKKVNVDTQTIQQVYVKCLLYARHCAILTVFKRFVVISYKWENFL